MRHLPSGLIFGRQFLIAAKLTLDTSTGLGSFRRRIVGRTKKFSGRIFSPAEDELQIANNADPYTRLPDSTQELDPVVTEIKAMKFPGIQSEDVRSDFRALLLEYRGLFRGVGLIADEEFRINLKPDTDIMRLSQKGEKNLLEKKKLNKSGLKNIQRQES